MGVTAVVDARKVALGNARLFDSHSIAIDDYARSAAANIAASASTPLYLAIDGKVTAVLSFRDRVRAEAGGALESIREMGIRTIMLSGDIEAVARSVAQELGIEEFHAQLSPADKIALVKKSRAANVFTAMVGDGINDAPALAAADIGIAIGSGTDAAKETGDIVLMRDDLDDLVRAIMLGRLTLRKVRQNLFWAFFYNVAGIPIAAGALYPTFGITLNPALAGLAMTLSSVSVVSNSLLLSRARKTISAMGPAREPPMIKAKDEMMESKMKCEKCGYELATPSHCDQQMHVEKITGDEKLVCWMGPGCGVRDVPIHCSERMHEVRVA